MYSKKQIQQDSEKITQMGGVSSVAKVLRMKGKKSADRVCNWRRRGVPAKIRMKFPKLFPLIEEEEK